MQIGNIQIFNEQIERRQICGKPINKWLLIGLFKKKWKTINSLSIFLLEKFDIWKLYKVILLKYATFIYSLSCIVCL